MPSTLSIEQRLAFQSKGDELVELLGRGRFGIVAKTYHPKLGMEFALKLNFDRDTGENEETLLSSIHGHPNIVSYYGGWTYGEMHLTRMKCVGGKTLLQVIQEELLSEVQIFLYFRQILSVLTFIHTKAHVVHRDLKAENIMVEANG